MCLDVLCASVLQMTAFQVHEIEVKKKKNGV